MIIGLGLLFAFSQSLRRECVTLTSNVLFIKARDSARVPSRVTTSIHVLIRLVMMGSARNGLPTFFFDSTFNGISPLRVLKWSNRLLLGRRGGSPGKLWWPTGALFRLGCTF